MKNVKNNKSLMSRVFGNAKLAIAAATVALGISTAAKAAVDVTSLTTSTIVGSSTFHAGVLSYGSNSAPPPNNFPGNVAYNMQYNGLITRVDVLHTSQGDYNATGQASAIVRRFHGPNTDILWYKGTGTPSSSTLVMDAQEATGFEQAFNSNNILVGTDNLFVNTGNGSGDNTNVERLDMIFNGGVTATSDNAFAVFDRGNLGDHDKFRVALITGLNQGTNVPTAYSSAMTFTKGTWGNTNLGTTNYLVLRKDNDVPGDQFHAAAFGSQGLGAVLLQLTELVPEGTTVYGYSLFGGDVAGNGNQLLDWTNTSFFPDNSADSTTAGGIDAMGTAGVLYNRVPEPSSLGLIGIAAGLLLRRKQK